MGDGSSYAGSQVTHTYDSLGPFEATLTVTDDDGASSTATVNIDVYAQAAGYYTGTLYSNVTQTFTDLEVIIGANHELHAWDWVNYRTYYWGPFSMDADGATGTLSAIIYTSGFVFPDGSTKGSVDLDATVFARQSITGTYVGVGDNGTIDVQYLPALSERPSSLVEVSGVWMDDYATIMISQSGELDYSDIAGCTGLGQMAVLEPELNGFKVQWDWNCPNLEPQWVGPSSGLVFIDDYYDPGTQWMVFAEALLDGTDTFIWSIRRPAPVAVSGSKASSMKSDAVTKYTRGMRRPKIARLGR